LDSWFLHLFEKDLWFLHLFEKRLWSTRLSLSAQHTQTSMLLSSCHATCPHRTSPLPPRSRTPGPRSLRDDDLGDDYRTPATYSPARPTPSTRRRRSAATSVDMVRAAAAAAECRVGLGQSCARRAPKFHCLITFFWAQIARKFRLSDHCENKNETRNCLAISPLTALKRHLLVKMAARTQIVGHGG